MKAQTGARILRREQFSKKLRKNNTKRIKNVTRSVVVCKYSSNFHTTTLLRIIDAPLLNLLKLNNPDPFR